MSAPTVPASANFDYATTSDVCARARRQDADRWLWHGYLAAGNVTLLVGQWKAGKTTLLSVLLARLGAGGTLAGRAVRPGRADGQPGERSPGPEPGQQDGQQRRLAGLPLADQQRYVRGRQVAVPDPPPAVLRLGAAANLISRCVVKVCDGTRDASGRHGALGEVNCEDVGDVCAGANE
jgi:hypothetical protein